MTQEIVDSVLHFINHRDTSETAFNEQALRLFDYQYKHNLPYQMYCRQKGKTPRMVKTWKDIPAVPINAFKELTLSCDDPEKAEDVFMTSGTTKGTRGKHYHPTLKVYNNSMLVNFKERFMNGNDRMRMGILFPTEEEMPNSSLSHYLALAFKEYGTNDSQYFVNNDGLRIEQLIKELERVEKSGEPFALLGASFSFVHLFEALETRGIRFQLPKGSRILDTGGFKNQSKELDLETFYSQLSAFLGVEKSNCINMYGMTELSTQFYDCGNSLVPSVKSGPHWIRTRVIHPLTGEDVAKGDRGVLVHCDLANFNSVTTILTEDLGVEKEDGFLLLGRVQGAEAKGCSIAVDEFLQATKGSGL
ncbi:MULTISPECIES: long-chain fatty acid--CoA ligase [Metabacillus]|uniref:Long-chain fatty acid--CoA ligase n=1 Tax=Metabacillus rhizolycopersici TaxID=2875709 RepID=A0ABS7UXP8_9BACI|nr:MULTISPECIES: long-chain fatty acid--CoA ligase [Metabacillus]MBZ5752778.1 long-chain fatty acid--CoA ligase [Metabacillus rhizolycopersici]MCM3652602.1 long-chain fatty acid--CoA ligase [Metabacillus litoralis]